MLEEKDEGVPGFDQHFLETKIFSLFGQLREIEIEVMIQIILILKLIL